jgi:hypothetical protein
MEIDRKQKHKASGQHVTVGECFFEVDGGRALVRRIMKSRRDYMYRSTERIIGVSLPTRRSISSLQCLGPKAGAPSSA